MTGAGLARTTAPRGPRRRFRAAHGANVGFVYSAQDRVFSATTAAANRQFEADSGVAMGGRSRRNERRPMIQSSSMVLHLLNHAPHRDGTINGLTCGNRARFRLIPSFPSLVASSNAKSMLYYQAGGRKVDRSDAARLLGSLPKAKRHAATCPVCAKQFQTTARGKFCSPICKARDQTRRKTEARRARWIGTKWETPSELTQ